MEFEYFVHQENFIEWLFSDVDDITAIGHRVVEMLKTERVGKITIHELFNQCDYIPHFIAHTIQDVSSEEIEEVSPSKCKLVLSK